MKKFIIAAVSLVLIINAHAASPKFNVDIKSILNNTKTDELASSLNKKYQIEYVEASDKNEKVLEEKTKKIIFLLLGDGDTSDETAMEFVQRREDYLSYMYNPEIPKKSDSIDGYDHDSQEWKDSSVAGISVPSIFNQVNENRPKYKTIDNIKIVKNGNDYLARVVLPDVTLEVADKLEPRKIVNEKTTLVMYLFFKPYKNDFYLYYLMGEFGDEYDKYLTNLKNDEINGSKSIKIPEGTDLSKLYNLSNMYKINSKGIVDNNIDKLLLLNTIYDGARIDNATGVMITNNILVTSYDYLQNALLKGQTITVSDTNGNSYKLDGIVSINPTADIALLKISGYTGTPVTLSSSKNVKVEDAVIGIGSKSGVGLTSTVSIAISIDSDIQTLIPMASGDRGGALFNSKGELVGILNAKSLESSTSYATGSDCLINIQKELVKDNDVQVTSFSKLKENYYNKSNDEEIKNNLSESKWNTFKKIGSLEETIFLPLVKASYKNNTLSLRYKNEVKGLITNEQLGSIFASNLKEDNYKEVLNSTNKKIYENNKYKVVIMSEFDYLIIVMVTK